MRRARRREQTTERRDEPRDAQRRKEKTIDEEIQPYIAMDGGGIEILEFNEDHRLIIRYEGSCTSCYSAIGGTLSAIQNILRTKLDPKIEVVPDPSSLDFDYE